MSNSTYALPPAASIQPPPANRDMQQRIDIVDEFEFRLGVSEISRTTDPGFWPQVRAQVSMILDDCLAKISDPDFVPSQETRAAANDFGSEVAKRSVRPNDVLDAGSVLFELVSESFLQDAGPTAAPRRLVEMLRILERTISEHVTAILDGYERNLLERAAHSKAEDWRRLARDIHDWVGNSVSLVARNLDLYQLEQSRGDEPSTDRIVRARAAVDDVLEATRRVISDLRHQEPATCISHALSRFVEAAKPERTRSHIVVRGEEAQLPLDHRDALFVMLRECLRNTIRHADAENVAVSVDIEPKSVRAIVIDDGVGFDVDAVHRAGLAYGLDSMRERAALLGGKATITSAPDSGTTVEISLPLGVVDGCRN
ncbi:sensor histidine kinase [Actinoalloteichus hymeniacidonis]|uniref:Oxygen sensor histidine kinase NreB n=1 Tax=Actinoalloteichus hymeniacidonis TaxID=340345 RepID=A0AAC9HTV3_9PSEU|nr:sensor histidine kinase [Actinoalloteichus hymeniacidonis]AOS65592.1 histidine kinase [Actinoalloteichus hymeniacidonis]MBB5906318.1 signal transduction histidine kinase [Actinoalloteichus hymeniacidonis]